MNTWKYTFHDRVSAEELFIELAVNNVDTVAADRLAIITGLDVNTLYEVSAFYIQQILLCFTRLINIVYLTKDQNNPVHLCVNF